jgi:hypothetical protein
MCISARTTLCNESIVGSRQAEIHTLLEKSDYRDLGRLFEVRFALFHVQTVGIFWVKCGCMKSGSCQKNESVPMGRPEVNRGGEASFARPSKDEPLALEQMGPLSCIESSELDIARANGFKEVEYAP